MLAGGLFIGVALFGGAIALGWFAFEKIYGTVIALSQLGKREAVTARRNGAGLTRIID